MAILFIFVKIINRMKYTNYIINGKVLNLEGLRSRNPIINVLLTVLKLPVAFMGIGMLSGMLPMTILLDGYRNTKCRLIHFQRKGYKL